MENPKLHYSYPSKIYIDGRTISSNFDEIGTIEAISALVDEERTDRPERKVYVYQKHRKRMLRISGFYSLSELARIDTFYIAKDSFTWDK